VTGYKRIYVNSINHESNEENLKTGCGRRRARTLFSGQLSQFCDSKKEVWRLLVSRDLTAHPAERIGAIERSMAEIGMDRAGTETAFSIISTPETGRILAER